MEKLNNGVNPKRVTILTGFLGSGKTTLLNAILKSKAQTKFAIIENEVGEIGIDGELIVKNSDSFTELNSGCICCSISDNFTDTLKELSERSDWDELIIEATGVADPGGILSPFMTFPWLLKYFQRPEVICIADARNIAEQLEISDTAASQLAYGDKIYLNKVDLVENDQVEKTKSLIEHFNPLAKIHTGSRHNIPLLNLLQVEQSNSSDTTFVTKLEKKKHHHGHDHFESISLKYNEPFNENQLYAKMYYHLVMGTIKLYRFKGVFFDSRKPERVIIQSAMKSLLSEYGEPWQKEEARESKFVFIGKDLNKEELDSLLKSCLLEKQVINS